MSKLMTAPATKLERVDDRNRYRVVEEKKRSLLAKRAAVEKTLADERAAAQALRRSEAEVVTDRAEAIMRGDITITPPSATIIALEEQSRILGKAAGLAQLTLQRIRAEESVATWASTLERRIELARLQRVALVNLLESIRATGALRAELDAANVDTSNVTFVYALPVDLLERCLVDFDQRCFDHLDGARIG